MELQGQSSNFFYDIDGNTLCTMCCGPIRCYTLQHFKEVLKSGYSECTTCNFEPCWEFWFIVLRDLTGQKNGRAFGL